MFADKFSDTHLTFHLVGRGCIAALERSQGQLSTLPSVNNDSLLTERVYLNNQKPKDVPGSHSDM